MRPAGKYLQPNRGAPFPLQKKRLKGPLGSLLRNPKAGLNPPLPLRPTAGAAEDQNDLLTVRQGPTHPLRCPIDPALSPAHPTPSRRRLPARAMGGGMRACRDRSSREMGKGCSRVPGKWGRRSR